MAWAKQAAQAILPPYNPARPSPKGASVPPDAYSPARLSAPTWCDPPRPVVTYDLRSPVSEGVPSGNHGKSAYAKPRMGVQFANLCPCIGRGYHEHYGCSSHHSGRCPSDEL